MASIKSCKPPHRFVWMAAAVIVSVLMPFGGAFAQSRIGTIPAGTTINVRTAEMIETNEARDDVFPAVVDQDVLDPSGHVVIPRGADAQLVVKEVSDHELALDLDSIAFNGQTYGVETAASDISSREKEGIGVNERTGKYVGGGAILGAIIGGIAGGGKGAAIGAGAGAAAGAGVQILTRGGKIEVPAESLLTFRLTEPLKAGVGRSGYYSRYGADTNNPAYQLGLREGRADAVANFGRNAPDHRWRSEADQRAYEAGYYEAYDAYNRAALSREKPAYSDNTSWYISSGPNNNINWAGPEHATVYVQVDNQTPKLFAYGASNTQAAPWIQAGHLYTFTLRDANGNEVARTYVDRR